MPRYVQVLCFCLALVLFPVGRAGTVVAASVDSVPALPAPTGTIVNVSTESQLQQAVASLRSDSTIVLAPGTYTLTSTLWINGSFTNIGIRGATNNRDDVVLIGRGMSNANFGNVQHGIWTGGAVRGITIANLTIRDVYYHPIMLNAGTEDPVIYNVRLINAGQQFVKANPDDAGGGVDRGRVEYSVLEYTTTSRDTYTNGVDVHTGTGWIIRHNLFRNHRAPSGLAGPVILVWNRSSNTTVESNTFVNCQREIALGLEDKSGTDHSGGVIRNNFIYRPSGMLADAAIMVNDSPGNQVLHNTVLVSGTYSQPIEYRFRDTTAVIVANNLLDGSIVARDGAQGTQSGNATAAASMFVNPGTGDLHLRSTATTAIDKAASTGATSTDWEGDARPQGSAPDIGADEYRSGSGTTPAPAAPTNLRIIR